MSKKYPVIAVALALMVGFALASMAGLSGCDTSPHDPVTQLLSIDEADLIVGPKKGKLYVFVDVHSHDNILKSLSAEEATQLLHRTAVHLSQRYMAKETYLKFTEGSVDVVSIPNKNEYGNGDFSSMVRHGSLTVTRRSDGSLVVSTDTLQYRRTGN